DQILLMLPLSFYLRVSRLRFRRMRYVTSRRRFLQTSAALAAASTLPEWFLEECAAAEAPAKPTSGNDQPGIGLIGCGGMGRNDAKLASRFVRVVAVCDVDESHIAEAKKQWPDAKPFKDFRKLAQDKNVDV